MLVFEAQGGNNVYVCVCVCLCVYYVCVCMCIIRGPEVQVLDYQTQQLQLFPLLAAAYALTLAGQVQIKHFYSVRDEIDRGNFEPMQEASYLSMQ